MKKPRRKLRIGTHLLILAAMLFPTWLAASAQTQTGVKTLTSDAVSTQQNAGDFSVDVIPVAPASNSVTMRPPSPLLSAAEQRVAAQDTEAEVVTESPSEILPPGTVSGEPTTFEQPYQVYLPLVNLSSQVRDIALHPDIWMASTANWLVYEKDSFAVRYPPDVQATISSSTESSELRLTHGSQSVLVVLEPRSATQPAGDIEHPSISSYRQSGYDVQDVSVKGVPSWEITPRGSSEGPCREVIVPLAEAWMRFQLMDGTGVIEGCWDREIFDLVLSSLQVRMGNQSEVQPQSAIDFPKLPQGVEWISYNRQAAYDYCAYYYNRGNSDGYDITGADGAHYIAHALCAGNFPIHWCAGQDHSSSQVINIASQRGYVLGYGDVWSTSCSNLTRGDIVYIGKGTCWGWGGSVVNMRSGIPYMSTHDVDTFDVRYDLYYSYCGTPAIYDCVHIDSTGDHYDPKLNSGLTLSPSTQQTGGTVTASFNIHNYGGKAVSLSMRVTTNGYGDFATTSCTLGAYGNCSYSRSRTFSSTFSRSTCAQISVNGGSWQNAPVTGSGVACRTLNIVLPADVRLSNALQISPSELAHNGGAVRAQFSARNYGGVATTERFRARVTSGSVTFSETGDVALSPNQSYNYDNSKTFSQPGIYEVIAEHRVSGTWTPLIGDGSGFVRIMEPPPPPTDQNKGNPPDNGHAGEPVNTATGNYFYSFTDLSDPTPGLSLDATRWYNALDAASVDGPFGHGTSWLYNVHVTWRADKSALVQMPDGHTAYYVGGIDPNNPTNMAGTYHIQDRDQGSTLVRAADGTAVLILADQTTYYFNTSGRLTRITHPHPAEITLVYSGTLPVQLVHSAGVTYTLTYSGSYITHIASSSGPAVDYDYSPAGDLITVTRSDGSTYAYTYDANHRLTAGYDPNGQAFVQNVYDASGRVVTQYDIDGRASTFSYGPDITVTRVYTDALGYTLSHTYNADYQLITETDALGHSVTYTRDAMGNVLTRTDKNGHTCHYTYDVRGNMLSETDPLGHAWIYTYDVQNHRTSQTNPLGQTWTYAYDAHGHLISSTDPIGHAETYTYDIWGNLISERDETGAETWYTYNNLGLNTSIVDPLGNVTRMAYDDLGYQTVYTDTNGHVATFVYDGLNRLVESVDPMGTSVTFTYDPAGNLLTESDGMGHLKHYAYDEYNRLITEIDFNGNATYYGYDALGRTTVVTDALGFEIQYIYDVVGNLAARRDKDDTVTQFEYDAAGNLLREIDPLGRITEYVHDAAGRQVEVRRPCAVCPGGIAVSHTTYDAAGRVTDETDARGAVTRYNYDVVGRLAIVTDALGYQTTYSYDPAGRLLQQVDPSAAVTHYEYDAIGQLITTTNALGFQTVTHYDAVGNRVEAINACCGSVTTYQYDANDRLVATTDALGHVTRNSYDPVGHLLSTTDPLNRTTTFAYDANGNQTATTDPRGYTRSVEYDALNRPFRRVEPLGHVTVTTYDALGRVVAETDALNHTRTVTYDAAGRRVAEQSPLGYTTVYTYDVADNLVTRQDPDGAVWQFEYDALGNQVRQTDPLGGVRQTEYDLVNRPVRDTDALGAVTLSEYDAGGRLVATTDPRGAVTRYEYDLLGQQVSVTDPLGHVQTSIFDGRGNLVAAQDARGFVTTYVYDDLDRQIAQTDSLGHTGYTLFDAAGQVTGTVDYNGNATTYTYDAAGNQSAATDALGNTTTTTYDELNRATSVADPLGRTRTMTYDELGRVVAETTPGGHTMTYTYDAEGRRIARTDALAHAWTTEYDAAGRPIRETDAMGRVRTTSYDALGRATGRTDPLGHTTTYTYDLAGRLAAVVGPDGTTQRYTYDSVGNLLSQQDGNGHVTRFQYDLVNNLVRKTDPLGNIWAYQYDAAGNQTGVAAPSGRLVTQSYDALGRLKAKEHDGAQVAAYAYDANGNRTVMTDTLGVSSYSYDDLNRLVSSVDAAGRTAGYTYDEAGQRAALTYPDGTSAHYAYDDDGNLSQVTAPDGGVTTYQHDALGRPTFVTQANGVTVEYLYDAVGNTLSIQQQDAGGVVFARHEYTMDDADRRVQAVETLPQGIVTTTYTYDALDRLTDSVASDGREAHYTFDAAGNRLTQAGVRLQTGAPEAYTTTYTYNAANQLGDAADSVFGQTMYAYDDDGYRTGEQSAERRVNYAYNAEGRLIEAKVQVWTGSKWVYQDGVYERYAYDGTGRRVGKESLLADDTLSTRRDYRYDDTQEWDVLQTYDAIAGIAEAQYLYDQSLHKLAYWQGGQSGYLQNDVLGSVLGATDGSGNTVAPEGLMRYDDYGDQLGSESALPTADGFTGYEREAYTSLSYARSRYYDAASGTFLSPDPFPAGQEDLLDLHRYLYVQANPINLTDPLGLFDWATGTVQQGDTLSAIAQAWGTTVDEILSYNSQITNRDLIYPGQHINLPPCRSAKCQAEVQQQNATQVGTAANSCGSKCGFSYTVKSGDTLSAIAARFGIPNWRYIWYHPKNYHKIANPNLIYPGQVFYIPCSNEYYSAPPGNNGSQPKPQPKPSPSPSPKPPSPKCAGKTALYTWVKYYVIMYFKLFIDECKTDMLITSLQAVTAVAEAVALINGLLPEPIISKTAAAAIAIGGAVVGLGSIGLDLIDSWGGRQGIYVYGCLSPIQEVFYVWHQ